MIRKSFSIVCKSKPINLLREEYLKHKLFQRSRSFGETVLKSASFKSLIFLKPTDNRCIPKLILRRKEYYKCNNYDVVLFGGILSFLGLEKEPEPESELIMTIKRSILLIHQEEPEKAEQMLHLALKLAQEQANEDGITYVYDVMANLAFETRQHLKAEKLFKSVLERLLITGYPQDDVKVVHISLKLAKIYEDLKDYIKAEQGYKFCVSVMETKMKDEDDDEDVVALWAMSLDWYARFLINRNRYKEAMSNLKSAYEGCLKLHGRDHEQTVVVLNDLGTVSNMMGDTEAALNYLKEAANIGTKLPDMQDLASIYVNLGQLYLIQAMYEESKTACKEGLKKAEKHENQEALVEAKHCLDEIHKIMS